MPRELLLVAAAGIALALLPLDASFAKLYKWVDQNGNVTYSERKPPADVKAETIKIRGSGISDETAKENLEELQDKAQVQQKDRQFAATASSEIKEREKRIKKNCEIARQNLRVLKNSSRIQDTETDGGTPRFLKEGEINTKMQLAAQQVKDFCQ